jgi:type II secretion system protein N
VNPRLQELVDRLRAIELTPRQKQLAVWIGYPVFALFVALLTLLLSIPTDRIKERLETGLSADVLSGDPMAIGMDVTIGDLSVTLLTGAGLKASNVTLRSRPVNPNDKPARYVIDDVRVNIGLLAAMFGRTSYSWKAHALQGTAWGKTSANTDESSMSIELEKLVLTGAPGIQQSVGLPLEGVVSGKLDLTMPKGLLATSNGAIDLTLDDAVIGDGKAKLTVPNDPFLSAGITFPKIKLGKLTGHVVIEKGRARFEGVRVHSADGDATLDGYVELHDPIGLSQIHAYLKFRPSEALTKREPTIELVNTAMSQAKRPDGFIGFQMTGPLQAMFFMPNKEPPYGVTARDGGAATTTTPPPPPSFPPATTRTPPSFPPPATPPATAAELPPPPTSVPDLSQPAAGGSGANIPTATPPAAATSGETREIAPPPPSARFRMRQPPSDDTDQQQHATPPPAATAE